MGIRRLLLLGSHLNLDTVFEGIVGMNDHRFARIQAGQDLCLQAAPVPDLHRPSAGHFVLNKEHRPTILVAEQGTAGKLQNLLTLPQDEARFDSVSVSESVPGFGWRDNICNDEHSLLFDAQGRHLW